MPSLFVGRLVMAEEPGWYLEGPHSSGLFVSLWYFGWDRAQRDFCALLFHWAENPSSHLELHPGRLV